MMVYENARIVASQKVSDALKKNKAIVSEINKVKKNQKPDNNQPGGIIEKEIITRLIEESNNHMAERAVKFGVDVFRQAEKTLLLQVLDQGWKDHLLMLDQMRQSIGLRAYAQKDPLNEYKREAFLMFETMLANMRETTSMVLSHVEIRQRDEVGESPAVSADSSANAKVSRNAPCPCGSGKKFKHCCGAL